MLVFRGSNIKKDELTLFRNEIQKTQKYPWIDTYGLLTAEKKQLAKSPYGIKYALIEQSLPNLQRYAAYFSNGKDITPMFQLVSRNFHTMYRFV